MTPPGSIRWLVAVLAATSSGQVPDPAAPGRELTRVARELERVAARARQLDDQREAAALRAERQRLTRALDDLLLAGTEAAERPLDDGEQALRELAEGRAKAIVGRDGIRVQGVPSRLVACRRAILLDAPVLRRVLPFHRFYAIEVRHLHAADQPDTKAAGERAAFSYQLAVLDARTHEVGLELREGWWTPQVERFLADAGVTARDAAELEAVHVARAFLGVARAGAYAPDAPVASGLSRAELDHRLHLGSRAGELPIPPHRLAFSARERHIVTWRLGSDDWGMPVRLTFDVLTFDAGGRCLGLRSESGPTLASGVAQDGPEVAAAADAFVDSLER